MSAWCISPPAASGSVSRWRSWPRWHGRSGAEFARQVCCRTAQAGFTAPTQDGAWVLAWDPHSATLHDLYEALGLPLAGNWHQQPLAPWQRQVAPAMERIVKAEAAAMRVTLAELVAEIRAPAAPLRRARVVADTRGQ